jgi:hypothetical protein
MKRTREVNGIDNKSDLADGDMMTEVVEKKEVKKDRNNEEEKIAEKSEVRNKWSKNVDCEGEKRRKDNKNLFESMKKYKICRLTV